MFNDMENRAFLYHIIWKPWETHDFPFQVVFFVCLLFTGEHVMIFLLNINFRDHQQQPKDVKTNVARNQTKAGRQRWEDSILYINIWMVVSAPLKNISQLG